MWSVLGTQFQGMQQQGALRKNAVGKEPATNPDKTQNMTNSQQSG